MLPNIAQPDAGFAPTEADLCIVGIENARLLLASGDVDLAGIAPGRAGP
ncbi:hypothetical protein STVA_35990 [Allostella vacuolata]|nr:hypothetical protein STVA_35990 [Stella vacuolata]